MSLSKVEKSIKVLEFHMKGRKELVDRILKKADPTQGERSFVGSETEMLTHTVVLMDAVKKGLDAIIGKMPPQATDLEEAVLGAVMLERDGLMAVSGFLKPEHFYLEPNALLYKASLNLYNDSRPVDIRTVHQEIRKMGQQDKFQPNVAFVIADMTSRVTSAANIEYHARIVVEYAMRRKLIECAGRIMVDVYDDTNDVFDMIDYWEKEFTMVKGWIK